LYIALSVSMTPHITLQSWNPPSMCVWFLTLFIIVSCVFRVNIGHIISLWALLGNLHLWGTGVFQSYMGFLLQDSKIRWLLWMLLSYSLQCHCCLLLLVLFNLIYVVVFCFKHMFLFPLTGKTLCSSCPYITESHNMSRTTWQHSWIGSCPSDCLAKGVYFQDSLISRSDSPSWIFLVGCCERWGLCQLSACNPEDLTD
jgi:hypothetical protein